MPVDYSSYLVDPLRYQQASQQNLQNAIRLRDQSRRTALTEELMRNQESRAQKKFNIEESRELSKRMSDVMNTRTPEEAKTLAGIYGIKDFQWIGNDVSFISPDGKTSIRGPANVINEMSRRNADGDFQGALEYGQRNGALMSPTEYGIMSNSATTPKDEFQFGYKMFSELPAEQQTPEQYSAIMSELKAYGGKGGTAKTVDQLGIEQFRSLPEEEQTPSNFSKIMSSLTAYKGSGRDAVMPYQFIPTSSGIAVGDRRSGGMQMGQVGGAPALPVTADTSLAGRKKEAEKAAEYRIERKKTFPKMRNRISSLNRQWDIVDKKIDEAIELVGPFTTGVFSSLSAIPGTPQKTLKNRLFTIRANVGFDKLQDIRDNSPTGGALGQISDFENQLSQAVHGSLEQDQTPQELVKNLTVIKENLNHARNFTNRAYEADYSEFIDGSVMDNRPLLQVVTATNPDTGERIIYREGEWQPHKTYKTDRGYITTKDDLVIPAGSMKTESENRQPPKTASEYLKKFEGK